MDRRLKEQITRVKTTGFPKSIIAIVSISMLLLFSSALMALEADDPHTVTTVKVYDNPEVEHDPGSEIKGDITVTKFFVSKDMDIRIGPDIAVSDLTFYVHNRVALTLTFDRAYDPYTAINFYTVTGDEEEAIQGMEGILVCDDQYLEGGEYNSKVSIRAEPGQTFTYVASMIYLENSDGFITLKEGYANLDPSWKNSNTRATITSSTAVPELVANNGVTVPYRTVLESRTDPGYIYCGAIMKKGGLWTVYPEGSDIGTKTFDLLHDSILVYQASVTAKFNDLTLKMEWLGYYDDDYENAVAAMQRDGFVEVGGSQKSGSIDISGKSKVVFTNTDSEEYKYRLKDGTITIGTDVTISGSIVMAERTTLVLNTGYAESFYLGGYGKVKLDNKDIWTATGLAIDISDFRGSFDADSIQELAEMEGDISTVTVHPSQKIKFIGNTTIHETLFNSGTLIIDKGVTLTVECSLMISAGMFSKVENNGTIIVHTDGARQGIVLTGGEFVNNGTLRLDSSSKTEDNYSFRVFSNFDLGSEENNQEYQLGEPEWCNVVNNGAFIISVNDTYYTDIGRTTSNLADISNSGTMDIRGTIVNSSIIIDNSGDVILNGELEEPQYHETEDIYDNFWIMLDWGGRVEFKTATFNAGSHASVNVIACELGSYDFTHVDNGYGSAVVKADSGMPADGSKFTVRSLSMKYASDHDYDSALDIRGFNVTTTGDRSEAYLLVDLRNCIHVTGSLTIPRNVNWRVDDVKTAIDGTMTIDEDCRYIAGVENTYFVEGKLIVKGTRDLDERYIQGAMFDDDNATVYMPLDEAVKEAQSKGIGTVHICPDIPGGADIEYYRELDVLCIVTYDLTIPAGMVLEGSYVEIGNSYNSADLTVEDGAYLSVGEIEITNGRITIHNSVGYGIDADVIDRVEDAIVYSSLRRALEDAESGDMIIVDNPVRTESGRLNIPEGVTVDFTKDGGKGLTMVNTRLRVEGTLMLDNLVYQSFSPDPMELLGGGCIMIEEGGRSQISEHNYTPTGLGYLTDLEVSGSSTVYYVIRGIDAISMAIEDTYDGEININNSLEDREFVAESIEQKPITINMRGDLKAETVTLKFTEVSILSGKKVDTTFITGESSIEVKDANITERMTMRSTDSLLIISGALIDDKEKTYSVVFRGDTVMEDLKLEWGNYIKKQVFLYPDIRFEGSTRISGKENRLGDSIHSEEHILDDISIPVNGTLTVGSGALFRCVADLDVMGQISVEGKAYQTISGRMILDGDMFIGMVKKDVFSAAMAAVAEGLDHYDDSYGHGLDTLNGTASFSGRIDLESGHYITVHAGSTIDPVSVEDLYDLEIIADESLWMTVYGDGEYSLDGIKIPLEGCLADGASSLQDHGKIVDGKDKTIAKYDQDSGVIYDSDHINLKDNTGAYLNVRYDVFTAYFKTDSMIKAVYVDGILTTNSDASNVFVATKLLAGKHTVKVEPIAGCDVGNVILYDNNGKEFEGLEFSFTSDDCRKDTLELYYNLSGSKSIEPAAAMESEITNVLLYFLAVLIGAMILMSIRWLRRS